jgi:hypothetical protein
MPCDKTCICGRPCSTVSGKPGHFCDGCLSDKMPSLAKCLQELPIIEEDVGDYEDPEPFI